MTKIQIAERTTATQLFFLRGVFSNFYPASFVYKGLTFSNSEQAFMWEKSRHFGDTVSCTAILNTTDPVKAKALGRAVKGYMIKNGIKFVMVICLRLTMLNMVNLKNSLKF